MNRFVAAATSAGRETASNRASSPTTRFPSGVKPTSDGVSERPPRFATTRGLPFSTVATALVEVPRSMPTTGSRIKGEKRSVPCRVAVGATAPWNVARPGGRVLQAPSGMVNVSVARRYARALLEASAPGALVGTADQLSALAGLVASNPALADVIVNPAYSRAQRHGVVDGLIELLKLESTVLRNFLRMLVNRNRLAMLPDIARLFRDMADEKAGRVRGTVVSAIPLDPQSIRQLESTLSRVVQKQVVLDTRVDREVLGGVSTQVGSVVFDGTLRTQLDELKRALQS